MTLNVFDWTAGPFLTFYICAACIALTVAFAVSLSFHDGERSQGSERDLTPVELAMLSGGFARAADTVAIEALVAGDLTLSNRGKLQPTSSMEMTALVSLPFRHGFIEPMARRGFVEFIRPGLDGVRDQLVSDGWAVPRAQAELIRRATTWITMPIIGIGLIKIMVGLAREKPVGILTVLIVLTIVAAWWIGSVHRIANGAGEQLIMQMRTTHERLARAPLPDEVLLAFAIAGPSALAGTALSAYAGLIAQDGGDGGCGGGGGGGGGCGGCGGGH